MKLTRLKSVILFSGLLLSTNMVQAQYLETITADDPITLGASQAADTWYVDRYAPSAFEVFNFSGENVIRHAIDGINDGAANRGAQGSTFYNTQGRKYDLGPDATVVLADIYIPASFENNIRRVGLWVTAEDASNNITAFPILSFRNVDGMSPTFSFYSSAIADWVDLTAPITYDSWHSLRIYINEIDEQFEYYINGTLVGTDVGFNNTTNAQNMILQAYNFNDPALDAANQSDDSYEFYWDNIGSQSENTFPEEEVVADLPVLDTSKKVALVLIVVGFAISIGYRRLA